MVTKLEACLWSQLNTAFALQNAAEDQATLQIVMRMSLCWPMLHSTMK